MEAKKKPSRLCTSCVARCRHSTAWPGQHAKGRTQDRAHEPVRDGLINHSKRLQADGLVRKRRSRKRSRRKKRRSNTDDNGNNLE